MTICWDFDTVANCPDQRRRCNAQGCIETWSCPVKVNLGSEFLVLFSSPSFSFAFKSSLKTHQKKSLSEIIIISIKTLSFWTKKVVIWRLNYDDSRARGKRNHKFCACTFKKMKNCLTISKHCPQIVSEDGTFLEVVIMTILLVEILV